MFQSIKKVKNSKQKCNQCNMCARVKIWMEAFDDVLITSSADNQKKGR